MNVKPVTDEAKDLVWAAYEALDEKQKRAITRFTARTYPKLFKYWVHYANLVRGCDQRMVVSRNPIYGPRLDKALKEINDGDFAAEVFAKFLMNIGIVDDIISGISDSIDTVEFEQVVDGKATSLDSEYAAFVAAFVKCYPPKHHGKTNLVNSDEDEMMGIVERLNKHAVKFEESAASLRLLECLPPTDITETVAAANKNVERIRTLMQLHSETTGCPLREYKTPADVTTHVKELSILLKATNKKDEIAHFLQSLVDILQSLKVTHRSVSEQKRLSSLRDQAVGEVKSMTDAEEQRWAYGTERDGAEWLRWAFEIEGDDLEVAQSQIKSDGYEQLSELIGLGDVGWISDAPSLEPYDNKQKVFPQEAATADDTESDDPAEPSLKEGTIDSTAQTISLGKSELEAKATDPVETPRKKLATLIEENADFDPAKNASDDPGAAEWTKSEVTDPEICDVQTKTITWEEKDIHEIAKVVANSGEKVPVGALAALAAKLALNNEFALAYHLILNAGLILDMKGTIPSWVYGSVACGSAIQGVDQSANIILQSFFQQYQEQFFDELDSTDRMAARLLLAASGIEPALFFPITGAASFLQTLHLHKLPSLQALIKAVVDYGSQGVGLPRSALFSTISADELKQKRVALQEKAKEWLVERAPQFDIISRPGKDVWRAWIKKTGPLGSMLIPVIEGQTTAIQEIRSLAELYTSIPAVDQEARRLLRQETNHRGDLLRPALNMIRRHIIEAIDIVNEWIGIVESQPSSHQRFDEKMLTQLRNRFADHAKPALTELEDLSDEIGPVAVRAGALKCARVVNDIALVLEGSGTQIVPIRNAHRLLHDDLLRVPMLQLKLDGSPRLPNYSFPANEEEADRELSRKVVIGIATGVAQGLPTMQSAVRTRGEIGDHEATGEILKHLEISETTESLKRLEQERTNSVTKHKKVARKQLTLGQRALSDALTKGLYDSQEYERWAVQLESADRDMRASGFVRFADVYEVCERLNAELDERKIREIKRMRKEIAKIKPTKEQQIRLDLVLSSGDVHTATDYLDRIRNQIELPDAQESEASPFIQFFGKGEESACELIERELREANAISSFVDRVAKKKRVSGLQLAEMQTTQAKKASEFIEIWFKTKTARNLNESNSLNIFSFFGMRPKKLTKAQQSRGSKHSEDVWDLQVEPLETRDVCPSAIFGSGAHGNYTVVGYWLRPAAEDILQHARELDGKPVIVLYFGRMSMAERRNLAAEQGRSDVIVIDDILAVFLAGQRKGRMLSFFLCSLPFSRLSPYTKAASLLPPEMFYGRHREIKQLMSDGTDSSCLLYGGRQIGKTVLLRHVQRLFEQREPSTNVATYIDLKGKEIGTNRPMDEVWLVIAEELAKKKVITEKVLRQTKQDWLFARIEEWLTGDAKRRILVLLDEADAFLAADAKGHDFKVPFSACTVLKDLMERTNRRFKLVFAGLHNVQTSTKVSNNPLAHFGEPICIGAMTDAGESREAEALIMEPLAAAGYFFESADLPARILAQTNYYPNLIQIYCDELLKYMQQRSRVLFPSDKTPPCIIGAKILEDVYERHELREELRLRFKWTLELDRRFELIANILALNDVDCTKGMEVTDIRQNTQLYWEDGFCTNYGKPLTYEGFRDLLEEMVGLGILRRAESPDHYALRNPNVLNLIGSRGAVERLLEDAHKWEPVEVYDPTKFRGQISEKDKTLRSPLNAAQELKLKSETNQVCIVCGCPAGQLEKVDEAISYRFGKDGFVRVLLGHEDLSHFQSELAKLGNRKSGGTTLIVVPDNVQWDRRWIEEARNRVSRFKKAKGAVCVVFVTGPERLFSIVPYIVRNKFEGVNLTSIQPWDDSTVNQWLQEGGHSAIDVGVRARLSDITGNWPVLLEEAVNAVKGGVDDAEDLEQKVKEKIFQPERKRELYDLFGLLPTTEAPLQFLCENGSGWNLDEISELLRDGEGNISVEHVTHVMAWAELIGIARHGT